MQVVRPFVRAFDPITDETASVNALLSGLIVGCRLSPMPLASPPSSLSLTVPVKWSSDPVQLPFTTVNDDRRLFRLPTIELDILHIPVTRVLA